MQIDQTNDTPWQGWPVCPQCSRRRQVMCPTCQVAGTDFELAEYLAPVPGLVQLGSSPSESTEQQLEMLLICPTCDEAFAPLLYRFCEQCGHDFESGVEVRAMHREELTARMMATIVVLLVLTLGIMGYFWFILS